MRTLKVMMAYCGTRYHGYQRQNNANTVQAVVEAAVSKLLNTPTVIAGCSRTDTGVHAEQFCFFFGKAFSYHNGAATLYKVAVMNILSIVHFQGRVRCSQQVVNRHVKAL